MSVAMVAMAAKVMASRGLVAEECSLIEGLWAGSPTKVWIDRSTFLVRRVESSTEREGSRSQTVTSYRPVVNDKVREELFVFPGDR